MKRLLIVTIGGAASILLLAFAGWAGLNIWLGRPIPHATGVWAVVLQDTVVLAFGLIIAASVLAYWIWTWFDPENALAHLIRHLGRR